MKINVDYFGEKYLLAKCQKWDLQIEEYTQNTLKIFLFLDLTGYFGNKFIGFYDIKTKQIKAFGNYTEKNLTEKQKQIIKKYCEKFIKILNN